MGTLKIAAWNSNGASSKTKEILAFFELHDIDILLLSETHFFLFNFRVYGFTLHSGAAILATLSQNHIQAVVIQLTASRGNFNVASVYCPPTLRWTDAIVGQFITHFGTKFLATGDWNAKHRYTVEKITGCVPEVGCCILHWRRTNRQRCNRRSHLPSLSCNCNSKHYRFWNFQRL